MNYYLRDVLRRRCRIVGIDINPHVVSESQKMAKRLGYHNMEFITADLRTYQPPEQVTAVISLHACDIATDWALGTAIRAKANILPVYHAATRSCSTNIHFRDWNRL